jgi:hypothetical protein
VTAAVTLLVLGECSRRLNGRTGERMVFKACKKLLVRILRQGVSWSTREKTWDLHTEMRGFAWRLCQRMFSSLSQERYFNSETPCSVRFRICSCRRGRDGRRQRVGHTLRLPQGLHHAMAATFPIRTHDQRAVLGVAFSFAFLAFLAVALRLIAHAIAHKRWTLADYFIIVACV